MSTELDRQLHASVQKREAEKEKFYQDERNRMEEEANQLGFGGSEMSKAELRKVVDSDRRMYYRTEELNDKLYIHYKGWKELKNLDGWTGLKAMYAECNAFDRITGLHNCRALRSLFLQENCIKKIDGLDTCTDLWSLNLSNNFIERIEGLSKLKNLNSLIIAKNRIGINGLQDVEELVGSNIVSLDIQDNKISDSDVLPEILTSMVDLRVLYMKGNPCAKKIPNYRKSTTAYCKDLRYLDDRPVFEDDRRAAEAFNRGGLEEERAERKRVKEEKSAAHDRNMQAFQDMIVRAKSEKREKEAMRLEDRYTEAEDPGLHQQRLMKQRHEAWETENADVLKDHDLERAQRILAKEREANGGQLPDPFEVSEEKKAEIIAEQKKFEEDELKRKEVKEDKRKLIYEDIWDDSPSPWSQKIRTAPSESKPKPESSFGKPFLPPPRSSSSTASVSTTTSAAGAPAQVDGFVAEESFKGYREGMVFKLGAAGVGYYPDAKQGNSASTSSTPSASDAVVADSRSGGMRQGAGGNSWYSKYSEKMQASEATTKSAIHAAKTSKVFAPPARGTPVVPETPAPTLTPAADAAAEGGDSELHEMD